MKKMPRNIFSRKNQSLFDAGTKMKDMDNVEVILGPAPTLESGTASVRARPTVKHHSSTNDSFQGFAVPTPTVPVLPSLNGVKTNGSAVGERMSNGSSIFNFDEDEIFVPPPPTGAAPPPPGSFILPPPDFLGELSSADMAALQASSVSAPAFNPLAPSLGEDLSHLKPPPMAPPKPPSTCSTGSSASLPRVSPLPAVVPQAPRFAPPQPPNKNIKTPPPKPTRNSSVMNIDLPPETPAPPPPMHTPTQSTFNPQNTAKVFDVPKISVLGGLDSHAAKPKPRLLLEDSGSPSSPTLVQVDGKPPSVSSPAKTVPYEGKDLKEMPPPPAHAPPPDPVKEPRKVSTPPEISRPHQRREISSANLLNVNKSHSTPGSDSAIPGIKYSPILDKKLRELRSTETHGSKEGGVASPLALLKAAKDREKHRSSHSHENDFKASIHPSDPSTNRLSITPRSSSSSSLTSLDTTQSASDAESRLPSEILSKISSPPQVRDQAPGANNPVVTPSRPHHEVTKNHVIEQSRLESQPSLPEMNKDVHMPLLPPPPEFDDFEDLMAAPPSVRPPDPPIKKVPTPVVRSTPIPQAPSLPNITPPVPPKLPSNLTQTRPKQQAPTKTPLVPNKLPATLSPSQATLLSILQKKMLEMDTKMTPMKEPDDSDEWGNPLSDEVDKIPVVSRVAQPSKSYLRAATMDMGELEGKMARKSQESTPKKTSSKSQSSTQQFGMTFTVRPGTKQPITLVRKGDP